MCAHLIPSWRKSWRKKRRIAYRERLEELAVREQCVGRRFEVVLDFGCGKGRFAGVFSRDGSSLIGVEVQPNAVREARGRYGGGRVLFIWYGGDILPVRGQSVDLVLSVGVIRSVMDHGSLEVTLREWHRCLKQDGCLLVIETDNSQLRRHMDSGALKETIVAAGFELVAWYPVRKTGWLGIDLVKLGVIPEKRYRSLAEHELRLRKQLAMGTKKRAYLGEFRKLDVGRKDEQGGV